MVKLSRKLEYALISLKHLSQKPSGELTSAKEISNIYGVSFDVISRVLQTLNQGGVVKSIQGVQGGYHLLKGLGDVSFFDLIEIIEGPLSLVRCIHDVDACDLIKSCNIVSPLTTLNHKVNEFYKTIKIAELVQAGETGDWRPSISETKELEL